MLLKGSAVPLGLGTVNPCCWSSTSLAEMTSLAAHALPTLWWVAIAWWLTQISTTFTAQGGSRHNTIYIPCLSPRPRKYRSFLKWLRVVTYLLGYKSKRTMYSLCFPPHTLDKKMIVQKLNGRGVWSVTLQAIKSSYQKCTICNDQSIEKGL